jgi:hypothetical protein
MNEEETKSLIISDLLKIDEYKGRINGSDHPKSENVYQNLPFEIIQEVHSIVIRHLLDYKGFGFAYPSVIESLEYTNSEIIDCIENHKYEIEQDLRKRGMIFRSNEDEDEDDYDHREIVRIDNDYVADYFDAMTDGQLGDYDDFKERGGTIDDIDTWARG